MQKHIIRLLLAVCIFTGLSNSAFADWPTQNTSTATTIGQFVYSLSPHPGKFTHFSVDQKSINTAAKQNNVVTANNIFSAPAPTLSTFSLVGITSAIYNPQQWSTPLDLNWDIVPQYSYAYDQAYPMQGAWMGFVTYSQGYTVQGSVVATYKGASLQHYPVTYPVANSSGVVVGWYDVFYCSPCTGGGQFQAQATGINVGPTLYSSVYIY